MRKLYLHIGSYKTGTTSIQSALHKNRVELEKQGFVFPGNEANHHKFFFTTKSQEKYWPRQFKNVDKNVLKNNIGNYLSILEKDIKSRHQHHIISTEYLFINNKMHIKNVIDYLDRFFSEIVVIVFLRDPIDYYISMQQQMMKARSYITSPDSFRYQLKNVIEAWSSFCKVHVLEYTRQINSCSVFCDKLGVDYSNLTHTDQRSNASISIEQITLLEKIQRNIYPNKEDVFKPHLGVIQSVQAPFTTKPTLKEAVRHLIYQNHREDLEWLKQKWSIDFTDPALDASYPSVLPEFSGDRSSVREVYEVDEQAVERYEALIMDALLKNLTKNGTRRTETEERVGR